MIENKHSKKSFYSVKENGSFAYRNEYKRNSTQLVVKPIENQYKGKQTYSSSSTTFPDPTESIMLKDYFQNIKNSSKLITNSLKSNKFIENNDVNKDKKIEKDEIQKPKELNLPAMMSFAQYESILIENNIKLNYEPRKKLGSYSLIPSTFHYNYQKLNELDQNEREKNKLFNIKKQNFIKQRKIFLTNDEKESLKRIMMSSNQIIIDKFNVEFKTKDLMSLSPGTWLNDEVINFYMNMLQEYDEKRQSLVKNHYFNSFFMTKYFNNRDYHDEKYYSYNNIKRWTKKFNIFEKNKIFFPVNWSNTHWTLSYIDIIKKEIHYIDSFNSSAKIILKSLLDFLENEAIQKGLNPNFNRQEWNLIDSSEHTEPIPKQRNGYDCGMFTIIAADYLTDDLPLEYSGEEMSELRKKVAYSISRGSLLYSVN